MKRVIARHDGAAFEQPLLTIGPSASDGCLRWKQGTSKRYKNVTDFRPAHYEVSVIEASAAKAFVEAHHYIGKCSQVTFAFGLFDARRPGDDALVGVAVFGNAMHPSVLRNPFPTLTPYSESLELSRFVLLDEVPSNAESWMLGRLKRQLWDRGIQGVVAFSDPVARVSQYGTILRGHVGTIYQATNAIYAGRTRGEKKLILPDGKVITRRTLSKARNGEVGGLAVERGLVARGARKRGVSENSADWLTDALHDVGARWIHHPGTHRYLLPIGDYRKRPADRAYPELGILSQEYPKLLQQTRIAVESLSRRSEAELLF